MNVQRYTTKLRRSPRDCSVRGRRRLCVQKYVIKHLECMAAQKCACMQKFCRGLCFIQYNTIQYSTVQYSTVQYNILYWSLLLGKLPFLPRAYINLHTDYVETMYIHCIRDMHYSKRHWSKSIWQAHRPPQALRVKTVTACGTNEFEYLTVLAFGTLILPQRIISRLSNSCLKGCVMSCSISFSLLVTRLSYSVSRLSEVLPTTPLAFLIILSSTSFSRLHASPPQAKRPKVRTLDRTEE